MKITTVLLAAGKGTRMRSKLPKVLHPIAGKPLLWHCLENIKAFTDEPPVVVIGHASETLQDSIEQEARFVIQEEQLGTGHAVLQAETLLKGKTDLVLVVQGDMPLLTGETLRQLVETQKANSGPLSMLTVISADPRGFGRILRDGQDNVTAIVEEVDCTPQQLAINELNVGAYCFQADWLWENLKRIPVSSKKEYFLTDTVGLASQAGLPVKALTLEDPVEGLGINTRAHLAEAEAILRRQINQKWMLAGVTIVDPASTHIAVSVTLGQDTVLHPNTLLEGETHIGQDCRIGPNAILRDTQVGDDCQVFASVLEEARLENHVDVGPFAHLRKGAHLADGVHLGNFGEVKESYLGPGVKMGHFSYIGDATIGPNVNIGAGTITCNYDGTNKHHTTIEADVFIGSDTMLVAPLTLGARARTGAGSVVTKNVKEDTLVAGVPARAIRKLNQSE